MDPTGKALQMISYKQKFGKPCNELNLNKKVHQSLQNIM
jgi:hypothetical protein